MPIVLCTCPYKLGSVPVCSSSIFRRPISWRLRWRSRIWTWVIIHELIIIDYDWDLKRITMIRYGGYGSGYGGISPYGKGNQNPNLLSYHHGLWISNWIFFFTKPNFYIIESNTLSRSWCGVVRFSLFSISRFKSARNLFAEIRLKRYICPFSFLLLLPNRLWN